MVGSWDGVHLRLSIAINVINIHCSINIASFTRLPLEVRNQSPPSLGRWPGTGFIELRKSRSGKHDI